MFFKDGNEHTKRNAGVACWFAFVCFSVLLFINSISELFILHRPLFSSFEILASGLIVFFIVDIAMTFKK